MIFEYIHGVVSNAHPLNVVKGKIDGLDHWAIMQHQTDFVYYKDGRFVDGKVGQILIVPPHTHYEHGSRPDAEEGFVDDWMYFRCDISEEIFKKLDIPLNTAFDVAENLLLKPYIMKFSLEDNLKEIGYEELLNFYFYEMLVKIARSKKYCNKKESKQRMLLDQIRHEIISDYSSHHTLEKLAGKIGYSVGHFSALYRKFYGTSPIDDLINYRISVAKFELKQNEMSITEISKKCGFSSIHHFSRIFKRCIGVSPSEYRNM